MAVGGTGVSERLAVLIEGESLLNDAAAIVVFIVFRDAFVGYRDSSPLSVLETASRMSLGGENTTVWRRRGVGGKARENVGPLCSRQLLSF